MMLPIIVATSLTLLLLLVGGLTTNVGPLVSRSAQAVLESTQLGLWSGLGR